ncbi:prohead protease/major capsid protein fusion protein [Oceanicola sp. 502str15]|uniref:prohead protease/major capsid protein fusion protein n=1 Tax=Oceanicola sp. 502str15 TaxID=2696061 RepID=UPI00209456D2|nr:prohead protease/major capsid protein fusion protein [Oceanicola sp. 502str15]MCO6385021.1 peptidase [Oceanicola sp. 502str15]
METQELLTRRAAITPETFDADAGTVEAVASTFAPVRRAGFMERLDPAAINPADLVGLPVLDGHRSGRALDVVGSITAARMEAGALVVTIRRTSATDADPLWQRVADKTIRGVSIGYAVRKWRETTEGGMRVRTAVEWAIKEVSVVASPADPQATFRSEDMPQDEIETVETTEETTTETRAAIRQICRSAGMSAEQADDMIDRDLSITEARAEAFEAMQRRTPARIRTAAPANDDPAVTLTRRADALFARVSGEAPTDEARPYAAETLRDMARACVEAAGVSTRAMDADTLFRAAMHTTSDFPQLLTSTGNRTLTAAYQAAQSPVKSALARRTTMTDFRPGTRLKLSDIGTLEKVSESGEIKHTSRGEASESYALDTYATQFAISRKALINDDLGAFRDWGSTAGRMAAETEANLLLALLLSNPTMGEDNKALFHADHGNLSDNPGALGDAGVGVTGLSEARQALRGMKALDGKTPINVTPKFLLVGPEQETEAEQLLSELAAATVDDVNPFAKRLSLLVEPRITGSEWYVFADPAQLPVLEYAYLSSAQGPQMASREGWDVLGMEFRVVLDFGCGAVDWRGAFKNAGA